MTCHLGRLRGVRRLAARDLRPRGRAVPRAARPTAARQQRRRWRSCGPATSSGCPAAAAPGSRSCSTRALDGGRDGPRPTVLTAERQVRRLSLVDFPTPVEPLHRLRIPKTFNARTPAPAPRPRLDAAQRAASTDSPAADRTAPSALDGRRRRRARPAAGRDARAPVPRLRRARGPRPLGRALLPAAPRHRRAASAGSRSRTHTIARTFDRVCALLDELGYLDGDAVTPDGRAAARGSTPSSTCWPPSACAPGIWDGLDAGRAGRVRVRAGLRVPPARRRAARRGCRTAPCATRWPRWSGCGRSLDGARTRAPARQSRASPTSASPGRPTAGRRAQRLDAGAAGGRPAGRRLRALGQAARSTCSARSPMQP